MQERATVALKLDPGTRRVVVRYDGGHRHTRSQRLMARIGKRLCEKRWGGGRKGILRGKNTTRVEINCVQTNQRASQWNTRHGASSSPSPISMRSRHGCCSNPSTVIDVGEGGRIEIPKRTGPRDTRHEGYIPQKTFHVSVAPG